MSVPWTGNPDQFALTGRRFRAVGGAPAADAPGPSGQPYTPPAPVVLPPDQFMPVTAVPIYAQASQQVTGPASWTIPAAILTRLPGDNIGVIKDFFVSISNMLTTTAVTWALRINGNPVNGGLGAYTIPVTATAFVASQGFANSLTIRIPQGGSVDVQITVADGGTYTVGASYNGWFYARSLYDAYAALAGGQ